MRQDAIPDEHQTTLEKGQTVHQGLGPPSNYLTIAEVGHIFPSPQVWRSTTVMMDSVKCLGKY